MTLKLSWPLYVVRTKEILQMWTFSSSFTFCCWVIRQTDKMTKGWTDRVQTDKFRRCFWNLSSGSWTDIVPAGSASVSLPPRLCTRLPGVRSSARLRPRCPSATSFVDHVSACRSTHRACHHRRPSLPGGCCICLEQSAGDSTFVAVTESFPQ